MKSTLLMTSVLFLTVSATSVMSHAATVKDRVGGYKCVLKAGTLKFTGGTNSEAVRSFTDFESINIYLAKKLMSGALEPIAADSLEFKPSQTIVTVAKTPQTDYMSSDTLYPTTQTTVLLDKTGKQIKKESELPEGEAFTNVYTHTYENSKSGQTAKLVVTVKEEQITDHAKTLSADLKFDYKAPSTLPQPMQNSLSGGATADLTCEDQI